MGIKVRNVREYLSEISKLRSKWKLPAHKELWFRAEDARHHETRLQPGLYRKKQKGRTQGNIEKLLELEYELYFEFRRCGIQLSVSDAGLIDEAWDSYFLMQHHGVPTRLLDWSDGALIALHFAVRHKLVEPQSDSVTYVLNAHWLNELLEDDPDRIDAKERWGQHFNIGRHSCDLDENDWDDLYLPKEKDVDEAKRILMKTPETPLLWDLWQVTRRFAAQRSRFMIFGTDPHWLVKKMESEKDAQLVPITIPSGSIRKISQELRDAGVTESVVYPDLDGLGRELKQQWELRR